MNKTTWMQKASRTVGKMGLALKRRSPEIFMAVGIVGVAASTVLACKATLRVNEITDAAMNDRKKINDTMEKANNGQLPEGQSYTEEDRKHDLTIVYVQTGWKLLKLYAPSVILGSLSIASIISSNHILRKRSAALATAYTALDQSYKKYRERVKAYVGEEVEKQLYYGTETREIQEDVVDPDTGEVTTVKKTGEVLTGAPHSPYAVLFDELNENYDRDPQKSLFFLRAQQHLLNDRLRTYGHVFLNEVYDALSLPRTKAGSVVGWIYDEKNPNGNNYIDFGLGNLHDENVHSFITGENDAVMLDFNVDGVILDLLESHQWL